MIFEVHAAGRQKPKEGLNVNPIAAIDQQNNLIALAATVRAVAAEWAHGIAFRRRLFVR